MAKKIATDTIIKRINDNIDLIRNALGKSSLTIQFIFLMIEVAIAEMMLAHSIRDIFRHLAYKANKKVTMK